MALIKLIIFPNEDNEQSFEIEAACITVGSKDDNDIILTEPSISPHHFKIEFRQDTWYIVDLRSKSGTFVNEEPVAESPLDRGTILRAGDCHILFDVSEAEMFEEVESAQLPVITPRTGVMVGETRPCWRCQQPVPFGSTFCPQCGADQRAGQVPSPFVTPVETAAAPGAGLMPMVAFVCSLFGPLLFGFGWLIGIILGFISLSVIRRRGGHVQDVKRAHRAIYIGIVWFIILSLSSAWFIWSNTTENRIRRHEARVIEEMQDIAVAETYLKLSLALDNDKDGVAEYGQFVDLVSNQYGHVDDNLAESSDLHGFRFRILSAGEEGFTCAAEPINKDVTGRRTFIIREKGVISADELDSETPLSTSMKLKPLKISNAIEDHADELVRDLHAVAAEALRNKEYEKAQEIVRLTRERFPTAAAIEKLDAIEEKSNPFVVEIRSRELITRATNAYAKGQLLRSIETLQTIRDTYSTYSGIQQVEERIRELRDEYNQKVEKHAQELMQKAIDFDMRMQFDKAEAAYRTVVNRYKDTTSAREAERRIALLADRRGEKNAAELLQEALSMNLEKEYEAIYSRIEQLKSAFEDSLVVSQSLSRIVKLEKQCKARIHAAAGKDAFQSNNFSRALQCFKSATELDPALLDLYQKEYGLMLIHGVSNAIAASDYNLALAYADEYEKLHLSPELLSEKQVDQIRLSMAKLSADEGDYELATELIRACGDRLSNNYEMSFLAGRVFLNYGEPEESVKYLQHCMNDPSYADDARELLMESVIRSALYQQDKLIGLIDDDPELLTLIRTFSVSLPGLTNVGTTSTWQNLCITLCDDVEMTYELLTYSGAEADLFLEKKRARSELDAALKKLQKTLRNSLQRRRQIIKAADTMTDWWIVCHDHVTNYPSSRLTDDAREWIKTIARARKYSDYTLQYLKRAISIDNSNKNGLLDYLENLVYRLENKQPLRNVLGGVKRYLSDERSPNYARTGLNALAELSALEIDPPKMAEDFSHL
jgi:hypothetical protein